MEVSYKRDFHHSFLILKDQELPDCETYMIRMLLNSSIPGLLSCSVHKVNNQALFYYEITSKQSLGVILENQKINRNLLVLVMGAVIRVIEEMEAYLLNPAQLLLDPDYIYLNVADREIGFVCWPGNTTGSFLQLTEYLLPRIDHQDQEAVILGYQLYRKAVEDQIISEEIRQMLYREVLEPEVRPKEIVTEEEEESADHETFSTRQEVMDAVLNGVREAQEKEKQIQPGICMGIILLLIVLYIYLMRNQFFSWVAFAVIAGVFVAGAGIAVLVRWMRNRKPVNDDSQQYFSDHRSEEGNEEELPDLMDEAKTTLLFEKSMEYSAMLIAVNQENRSWIPLKKGTTILGKMVSAVDVVLPSTAVSRIHAKIHWDQECVIYDLNSKNGTYVNQESVMGTEGVKLQDGDLITLADLVYRYTIQDLHQGMDSSIMMEN